MKFLFFLLIYGFTSLSWSGTELNPAESQRYEHLIQEIRCLVCQNQSIADSNALLAKDLRIKVHNLILQNASDAEIKSYLVKRYGEFILLKPRLSLATCFLWFFPFLGLFISIFCLIRFFKKQTI